MMLTNGKKTIINGFLAFIWVFIAIFGFDLYPYKESIFFNQTLNFFLLYGVFAEFSIIFAWIEWTTEKRYRITLT